MRRERRREPRGGGSVRSRRGRRSLATAGLAAALVLASCGDDLVDPGTNDPQEPPRAPTSQLTFLRQSPDAPAFFRFDGDTSFVATRGRDTDIEIRYVDPEDPTQPGEDFLEFELDDESLARRPDGTEFRPGEQVTITLRIAGDTILADFEPSGLEFNPNEPAELEMRFRRADRDTDDDGQDDLEESAIRLWKQEQPGEDWLQFSEEPDVTLDQIRVKITSFTRWALAF